MGAEDPWKPFHDIAGAPLERAEEWKQTTGGKVIGHLLPDVPEEILHATGALPLAVEGAGMQPSRAQAHIPSYTCNHAMGAAEMGLTGALDFLDAFVIPYVCDTTRNLYHVWGRLFPSMHAEFLRTPKRMDFPGVEDYLKAEYSRLFESLSSVTSNGPSADNLADSIGLYNRSRAKLREAYRNHRTAPETWTASRVLDLMVSALRIPREEHLALMESLPWDNASADGSGTTDDKSLLYVKGKIWDPPQIGELFDSIGFVLVGDEVVTGYRGIAKDAPATGDPVEALAKRHLAMVPYAGYHLNPTVLVKGFIERVKQSGADAVLFLNPKFCEEAGFDTPDFQQACDAEGIKTLVLETSTRGVSVEQLRVRLEAFKEMISDDLP
jgi:benzoyl-CoA reductase subunit C